MKRIELRFGGDIYMEEFHERKEKDRVKIYDSDQNYLACLPVAMLERYAEQFPGLVMQDILDTKAQTIRELDDIVSVLNYLRLDWMAIYRNGKFVKRLHGFETSAELCNYEWVNRLGNFYVELEFKSY